MRVQYVEDASEKFSLQSINIYPHKFEYDKSHSSPHTMWSMKKSTVCHHLSTCSNSPKGNTLNHSAPFFASDLSHFQCGCQVNTMLNNILTWLPRQPHIYIFFFKILSEETKKEKANIDRDSWSWEETRGQFAPIHHGTTLKLLSTDSPSVVTRVPA